MVTRDAPTEGEEEVSPEHTACTVAPDGVGAHEVNLGRPQPPQGAVTADSVTLSCVFAVGFPLLLVASLKWRVFVHEYRVSVRTRAGHHVGSDTCRAGRCGPAQHCAQLYLLPGRTEVLVLGTLVGGSLQPLSAFTGPVIASFEEEITVTFFF